MWFQFDRKCVQLFCVYAAMTLTIDKMAKLAINWSTRANAKGVQKSWLYQICNSINKDLCAFATIEMVFLCVRYVKIIHVLLLYIPRKHIACCHLFECFIKSRFFLSLSKEYMIWLVPLHYIISKGWKIFIRNNINKKSSTKCSNIKLHKF